MEPSQQIAVLKAAPSFRARIGETGRFPIVSKKIEILQLNIIRKCNLSCKHCHVNAAPNRKETMSREILERCAMVARHPSIHTVDITGGAPEMNPHLSWFLDQAAGMGKRTIVRSNLVILKDPTYAHFLDVYEKNRVELCASLPDLNAARSDRQRGIGSYQQAIEVIKELNRRGYGREGSGLTLDLVHNPVGAYLPGNQASLAQEYKKRLFEQHGIVFNHLFCITNMPLGRYLDYLIRSENFEDYMGELSRAYNPGTVDNVMCKSTLSVGWDGTVYDCDFNQILCMPIQAPQDNIMKLSLDDIQHREIVVHNHCFGCTAGAGSSCQGETC